MKNISVPHSESLRFAHALDRLVADSSLEVEWLDLLSQLEYVGCRKILKSVPYENVTSEILQHVAEEASHAALLKNVAETLGLPKRGWDQGRFREIGWRYFTQLDETICHLPHSAKAGFYPSVTWAVESRVLKVYPQYIEKTNEPSVRRVLRRILAQEQSHSSGFASAVADPGYRGQVLEIEASQWEEFLTGLERLIVH